MDLPVDSIRICSVSKPSRGYIDTEQPRIEKDVTSAARFAGNTSEILDASQP